MPMTRVRTADAAVGRWPGILQMLNVEPQFLRNKHGPCPVCGGTDRYRFDDKDGRGTWICSHCGSGDGFKLLMSVFGWSFSQAALQVDRVLDTAAVGPTVTPRTVESKQQSLRSVWNSSRLVVRGDPVWLYLNRRLGIVHVPVELRFHPALRYADADGRVIGAFPAMVAALRYPDGTGASLHRTYLTEAGDKAPVPQVKKIMAGRPLNTAAVRLGEYGQCLGIAEGIESAIGAARRFGVPVWAATNATLLANWVPPAGVKKILIAGDNDANFTGQAAVHNLARRLVRDGHAVEISIPEVAGKDWADGHA